MYFETHAHYDDKRFDDDRDKLLGEELKENGIGYVINIGADLKGTLRSVELANLYDYIYASVGFHPHYAEKVTENDYITLEELAKNNVKVLSIGEIGLDFHYDNSPRDKQIEVFIRQLELAKSLKKPVIIHSREADQAVFDILKKADLQHRGIIHCYSGSAQLAMEYVKLGYLIGVGGVVTYKNARNLVETVENIPITSIVLETDCPYLSPEPNRGKRNSSLNLQYICRKISEIKHINENEVAIMTSKNAMNFFGIK